MCSVPKVLAWPAPTTPVTPSPPCPCTIQGASTPRTGGTRSPCDAGTPARRGMWMWVHICACMQPRACNHLSTAQGGEGPLPKGIGPGTIWERSRLAAHAGAQLVTQTRRVPYVRLSLTMETARQQLSVSKQFLHFHTRFPWNCCLSCQLAHFQLASRSLASPASVDVRPRGKI